MQDTQLEVSSILNHNYRVSIIGWRKPFHADKIHWLQIASVIARVCISLS
jgi:hypothetical protein